VDLQAVAADLQVVAVGLQALNALCCWLSK